MAAQGLTILERHAFDAATLDQHVRDFAFEAHLAAELDDFRTHLLDDASEPERADVRLADEEDLWRRTGAHELVHHLAAIELRILDLAVELAIGEESRPALAELHVGFGRQHILAPQCPGVLGSAPHIAATFEHDGLEPHLRKQQRGKQPAGAESDHDGPLGEIRRCFGNRVIGGVRREADLAVLLEALQHCRLVGDLRLHDADEENGGVLLARVVTAFEQRVFEQFRIADLQAFDDGSPQRFGRVIERQRQFSDAQHSRLPGPCTGQR